MEIKITNEVKMLSITFLDQSEYIKQVGTRPDIFNYYSTSKKNGNYYWLLTTSGLFDSREDIENNMRSGINEDASTFYNNKWGEINFDITWFVSQNINFYLLRSLLRYKGEPLKIEVTYNDIVYTNYFTLDNKNIEEGTSTFRSAKSSYEAFWYVGDKEFVFDPRNSSKSYLNMPAQVPLGFGGESGDSFSFLTEIGVPIIMELGNWWVPAEATVDNVPYVEFSITHMNTGRIYNMTFFGKNDIHIYDSSTFTHTYNGAISDQPDYYMLLVGGNETFRITHNIKHEYIRHDSYISIKYQDRRIGIGGYEDGL